MLDFNLAPLQDDPRPALYDIKELKRNLAATARTWVLEHFPHAVVSPDGREARLANTRGDRPNKNGSCVIDLTGPYAGYHRDWTTGEHGDQLDTLSLATGLAPDDYELFEYAAKLVRAGPQRPPAAKSGGDPAVARTSWIEREIPFTLSACRPTSGTLVEKYLNSRGLEDPHCPDLLFHPNLTDYEAKLGRPGMVAVLRRPDTGEKVGSIHRTYLAGDGGGKADMPEPRLSLRTIDGGVVMLAPMADDGLLGIAEGVETALAASKMFGVPVWSAISAGNMTKFAPPPGLKTLIVFADCGEGGEHAAWKLHDRLAESGIQVQVVLPDSDDDFNEDLRLGYTQDQYQPEPPPSGPRPDEADDDAEEPEITPPPRTCMEILAFIDTIGRFAGPAAQIPMIQTALTSMVHARLDAVSEKQCLLSIKAKTGTDLASLGKALRALRGELGIEVRSTGNPQVTEVCRRYVYVKAVNAFWDRQTRTIVSIDGVRHAHWAEMPPDDSGEPADPRDVLLKGIFGQIVDRVDTISFMPGAPEVFMEDGAVALNIWSKPDIVAVAGDVSPFLGHVAYILDGNSDAIGYFLDFLAHLIQKAWIKIKVAPLIIGKPGIGKSLIAEMISKLIGQQNTTPIEESDLASVFNEWMDGVQLVIVHELMTMARKETMNRLKTYIADPWLRINRKNVSPYKYRNRANFLMFSNYEDAAKIEEGDRRYFVWISQSTKREDDYYTRLHRWFENGGDEALLHFLQSRDISDFNPNAPAPSTPSKLHLIRDGRSAIERYLHDAFDAGDPPFQHDLVVINDVIEFLRKERSMSVSHVGLSSVMRGLGGVPLGQKRLGTGPNARRPGVWALRNVDRWQHVEEPVVARWYRLPSDAPLTDAARGAMEAELNAAKPAM